MNQFKQHVPRWIDGEREGPIDFETVEELLNLEVVKRFASYIDNPSFVISDELLMVVYDDGFSWGVVGYLKDPAAVDLPKWEGWKFLAEFPDGSQKVVGSEVVTSCGDDLTLKDGTVVKNVKRERE